MPAITDKNPLLPTSTTLKTAREHKQEALAFRLLLATGLALASSGCGAEALPDEPSEEEHIASSEQAMQPGYWWSRGRPPGLSLVSAPTACSWGPGRIDVFVRASDNHIWLMN